MDTDLNCVCAKVLSAAADSEGAFVTDQVLIISDQTDTDTAYAIRAENAIRLPDGFSPNIATQFVSSYGLAWYALIERAKIGEESRVLVVVEDDQMLSKDAIACVEICLLMKAVPAVVTQLTDYPHLVDVICLPISDHILWRTHVFDQCSKACFGAKLLDFKGGALFPIQQLSKFNHDLILCDYVSLYLQAPDQFYKILREAITECADTLVERRDIVIEMDMDKFLDRL